ncbi:MAG: transposase [Desulfosarcina sp.]
MAAQWLYQAKRRYGLTVLDYCVTSKHVHLLVHDSIGGDGIVQSVQLLAGRTGQESNQRKHRKGAFWEDRYHATAIEGGEHLLRCVVCIDLNMVRAGVVAYPLFGPTPPNPHLCVQDRFAPTGRPRSKKPGSSFSHTTVI